MALCHAAVSYWKHELLPHIVDHLAKVTPDSIYAEYPRSPTSYDEGFRPVTYQLLANAINGFASWLHNCLGPSRDFEALAYFGPNDIRFQTIVLGAVKAGYTTLLLSPRNSVEAQKSLCARVKCTKILSSDPMPPAAKALLEVPGLQHFTVPSVDDLLDVKHPPYSYHKTYADAKMDPFFSMHTSGSTGFPKPITVRHEVATRNMNMFTAEPPEGYISQNHMYQGQRLINTMPPFHGGGMFSLLFVTIPFGTVCIMPLPNAVPTAQQVVQMLQHTTAKSALVIPSIAQEFAQAPDLLAVIASKIELLLYIGGDLPQLSGDTIASKIQLRCQYGASEIGITPQIIPDSASAQDWKYVCFPLCMGIEFQEAADGTSELVVIRDPVLESTQPSFIVFPDQQEYRSQDLFTPRPRIPDLWAWNARADDIVVLLNGEKTNPVSFENQIVACRREVSAAIVVGAQRLQTALLLERADNTNELTEAEEIQLIERIWPTVEEANRSALAHARVEKSMILIMKPEKPARRAGKGTVQRAATVAQYSREIDQLYMDADAVPDINGERNGIDHSTLNVTDVIAAIKQMSPTAITDEHQNFFAMGMDSLGALQLTRKLRNYFGLPQMSPSQIYNHPSIETLAASIVSTKADHEASGPKHERQHEDEVTIVVNDFRDEAVKICRSTMKRENAPTRRFILTGSTGTIGGHLLAELLSSEQVDHIYCLNRRENAREIPSLPDGSHVNLADDKLGLPHDVYTELRENVTDIIHNAWPVNFNLSFDSFKSQLCGVLNIIKLASTTTYQSRTVFISSVSSVLGRQSSTKRIEERVYEDYSPSLENGYAESKWAAEVICNEAALLGLGISIARVGQIAGPVRRPGVWNTSEWFPSLILSSVGMGVLPDSLGPIFNVINFVPVDLLAEIIVDLSVREGSAAIDCDEKTKVWHLQNPSEIEWASLVPQVVESIQVATGQAVKVVPAQEWLSQLRKVLDEALTSEAGSPEERARRLNEVVAKVPAVKLLDFYTSIMSDTHSECARLDVTQTMLDSFHLAKLEAVNAGWMRKWIGEWKFQA